jgi:hypothetical protein
LTYVSCKNKKTDTKKFTYDVVSETLPPLKPCHKGRGMSF